MAGQQGDKLPTRLDQDLIHLIWLDDLNFGDRIVQLLPEIRNNDLIPRLQLVDIPEIAGSPPSAVSGNDCVGILAAHRDTGLRKKCCTIGHMLISGPEKHRHLQLQNGYGDDCEDLVLQAIVR